MADTPVSVGGDEITPLSIRPVEDRVWEAIEGEKLTIPLTLVWRGDFSGGAIKLKPLGLDIAGIKPFDVAAKAGVPFCIIHGDDDKLVPLGPNSAELKKRYDAAGRGDLVNLIVVEGQGHSFWKGFFTCQPLVDFLIARARAGTQ
jgi:hypothetical protein